MTAALIQANQAETSAILEADQREVRRFLAEFTPGAPSFLTSLPVDEPGGPQSALFRPGELDKACAWVKRKNIARNIYFHIGAPTTAAIDLIHAGKKSKLNKGDIASVSFLWVDIDPPANTDLDTWQGRILERLRAFPLPPSIVLASGGGLWAFWRLKTPFEINGDPARAVEFERYTRGLANAFEAIGGDKAFDVARIARLPGSINWPDEHKRQKGRTATLARVLSWAPEQDYAITEFDRWADTPPASGARAARAQIIGVPELQSLDDIPQLSKPEHATLRHLVENGEWPGEPHRYPSRSEAVFAATCMMIRAGVIDEQIAAVVTDPQFAISAHVLKQGSSAERAVRLIERAKEAVARDQADFACNRFGQVIAKNMHNVRMAIERLGVSARFNLLSQETIVTPDLDLGGQLNDAVLVRIRFLIEKHFGFLPDKEMLADVIGDMAREHAFHPIQDYLDGLSWDGVKRLDTWLSTYLGAATTPLNREIGAKFLIAAVRRVRHPGTKFDEMLVLEGPQGSGKSTALAILARKPEWFCDDVPLGGSTREIMEAVNAIWIAEISELSAFKRADIERIKQNLSKTHDKARLAYARFETNRPRSFVLAGTTNRTDYLADPTGNRRFWCVLTDKINLRALRHDVDQLWAEACVREAEGETLFLGPEAAALAVDAQLDRMTEDPWAALLREKLSALHGKIRSRDLMRIIGREPHAQTPHDARRMGEVMRTLGWERSKQRYGGSDPIWAYVNPPSDALPGSSLRELVVDVEDDGAGERQATIRYADEPPHI